MNDFGNVVNKMYEILLNDPILADNFYRKWGVRVSEFRQKITNPLTHGGYMSKITSINNLSIGKDTNLLDIGPEMGLEVFMFSEITDKIVVCDPDVSNLELIESIAKKYKNNSGVCVSSHMEFKPFGFGNDTDFIKKEMAMYGGIVNKLGHSLPAFYNVVSDESLSLLENKSFDLIFVHKILTTITRSQASRPFDVFYNAVVESMKLLNNGGVFSWTEPDFVWEQKEILDNFCKLKGIKVQRVEYEKDLPEKFVQILMSINEQ